MEVIADRGRELLTFHAEQTPADLCAALVSGRGEASGLALSRELLRAYKAMDREQRIGFFEMLCRDYGPDPDKIREATENYSRSQSLEDFLQLSAVVEPPRQELFRRLNMAPNATAALVAMRADLLAELNARPHLKAVDADLKHLLSSWFNRGFLRLERIDWRSPAQVLEQLINYESVHAIRGWDDLRRRLARDRRCFAFFHPAMPDEPLIFVEAALVQGMTDAVGPLLDPEAPLLDPAQADTAMFYSINNTQAGLRGISFGNFLIKQVLTELHEEFPAITHFATLSPMPRFAATLQAAARSEQPGLDRGALDVLIGEQAESLCAAAGRESPGEALLAILKEGSAAHRELLAEPLQRLALAYLTLPQAHGDVVDPVASFHLSNGARLERVNPFADTSAHGMQASFGVMVNYLYDPDEVEANHERFVTAGEIAMSKSLTKTYKRVAALRSPAAVASH